MKPYFLILAGVAALPTYPTSPGTADSPPDSPGKQLPSAYLPTSLKLFIGGRIFPPNYWIELQGDSLTYRAQTYDDPGKSLKETSRIVKPTPDQWRQFWKAMGEIGVWGWKSDYDLPGVADGTFWAAELSRGRQTIKSRGQNNYPGAIRQVLPGSDIPLIEQGPTFKKYLSAVETLLGGAPFQ